MLIGRYHNTIDPFRTFTGTAIDPTSKIPTEIISQIFKLVQKSYSRNNYPRGAHWISISHVSRAWRSVAIGCGSLWNHISIDSNPLWVQFILERSKLAPLTVTGYLTQKSPVSAIKPHVARFREISLACNDMHDLQPIFSSPTPLLEELKIDVLTEDINNIVLPDSQFSGEFPRLRRLELFNIRINLSLLMLKHLTSLTMYSKITNLKYPIDQILSALRHLPALLVLDLGRVFATIEAPSPPLPNRNVHLPQLTMLNIESGVLECRYFLDHVAFSSTTSLEIFCPTVLGMPEPTCLNPCLSYWGELYRRGQADPVRFARFSYGYRAFTLELWTTREKMGTRALLNLTIQDKHCRSSVLFTAFDAIFVALPMEQLQTLYIDNLPNYEYPERFQTLGQITTLEEIRIERCADVMLCVLSLEWKLSQTLAKRESGKRRLLFPALRRLDLIRCDLEQLAERFSDRTSTSTQSLHGCLQTRRDYQQGIVRLLIVSCWAHKNLVAKLREITNVEWDRDDETDST